MLPCNLEQIRVLSQDDGLNDKEIADVLGCSRATVNRARRAANIGTAVLKNRLDKSYVCAFCGNTVVVRRHERKKRYCEDCRTLNK